MASRTVLAVLGLALGASALQSVPAPGVPCSTVRPASPGYAGCDPTAPVMDYYGARPVTDAAARLRVLSSAC